MELGASIFIDANKNLLRAANEFNLSLYGFDDEDGDMAIWDGERISHRVCILAIFYLAVLTLSPKGDRIRVLGLVATFLVAKLLVSEELRLFFSDENASTVSHLTFPHGALICGIASGP